MIGNLIGPSDLPKLRESFSYFYAESLTVLSYFCAEIPTLPAHFGSEFSNPHPGIQAILGSWCVEVEHILQFKTGFANLGLFHN